MSTLARKIEGESRVVQQMVLEERIAHIQRDVAELKGDVKRIDQSLVEHRIETEKSIGSLRTEINDLALKLGEFYHLHIKWTVGTLIAATGTAFTIAKYVH